VAHLGFGIALDADDGHSIELSKCIGHTTLSLKGFLAGVAPSLKVIGVIRVLNEASRGRVFTYQVMADNCSNALAVGAAIDQKWFGGGHICRANYLRITVPECSLIDRFIE
jgi:hypothetical protein